MITFIDKHFGICLVELFNTTRHNYQIKNSIFSHGIYFNILPGNVLKMSEIIVCRFTARYFLHFQMKKKKKHFAL